MAEAAKAGNPMERGDADSGRWEPWFNFHGDPHVSEEGRGQFGIVATVSTMPSDYGKARAEFMAAACPAAVLALLDIADAAAAILRPERGDAPWMHSAEFGDLRAALYRADYMGSTTDTASSDLGPSSAAGDT